MPDPERWIWEGSLVFGMTAEEFLALHADGRG